MFSVSVLNNLININNNYITILINVNIVESAGTAALPMAVITPPFPNFDIKIKVIHPLLTKTVLWGWWDRVGGCVDVLLLEKTLVFYSSFDRVPKVNMEDMVSMVNKWVLRIHELFVSFMNIHHYIWKIERIESDIIFIIQ